MPLIHNRHKKPFFIGVHRCSSVANFFSFSTIDIRKKAFEPPMHTDGHRYKKRFLATESVLRCPVAAQIIAKKLNAEARRTEEDRGGGCWNGFEGLAWFAGFLSFLREPLLFSAPPRAAFSLRIRARGTYRPEPLSLKALPNFRKEPKKRNRDRALNAPYTRADRPSSVAFVLQSLLP